MNHITLKLQMTRKVHAIIMSFVFMSLTNVLSATELSLSVECPAQASSVRSSKEETSPVSVVQIICKEKYLIPAVVKEMKSCDWNTESEDLQEYIRTTQINSSQGVVELALSSNCVNSSLTPMHFPIYKAGIRSRKVSVAPTILDAAAKNNDSVDVCELLFRCFGIQS